MIKRRDTEFGSLPGGIPDTGHSEYLRGKLEVRNHASGTFTKRGNDVWAERSGRTYHGTGEDLTGGAMDYASPVSGSGMGKLSSLTGGKSKTLPSGLVPGLLALSKEVKGSGNTQKVTPKMTFVEKYYGSGNTQKVIPKGVPMEMSREMSKYYGSGNTQKVIPKGVPMEMSREMSKYHGGAVDALEIKEMMQRGANRARGTTGSLGALTKGSGIFDINVPFQQKKTVPFQDKVQGGRKPSARNMIVKKIMKQRGVSLPEASRIVKAEGLY